MNMILDTLPVRRGECYRVLAPRWLTLLLRLASAMFGLVTLWAAVRYWSEMPVWVNGLVCVLVPAFLIMAFHPRGWARFSTNPFLVADRRGLYFPSLRPRVLGQPAPVRWLFVPWSNVSNMREAKAASADGTCRCAAFDVYASADEVNEFFNPDLIDKRQTRPDHVPVSFYEHGIPHPREVLSRLRLLAS